MRIIIQRAEKALIKLINFSQGQSRGPYNSEFSRGPAVPAFPRGPGEQAQDVAA